MVTKIYIKDFEDINKNIMLGSFKKIYITKEIRKINLNPLFFDLYYLLLINFFDKDNDDKCFNFFDNIFHINLIIILFIYI